MTTNVPAPESTDLSITEKLSAWIEESRSSESPYRDSHLEATSSLVLDWLGSALAGCRTPAGRSLLAYAGREPYGPANIMGWPESRSVEVAALVNGALSHIVEMDDVERTSVLHPGAVVIPAALAVAEEKRLSGRELLVSILVGYEVAIRIGSAVGDEHYYYFHNTSTCGIFGAAAAAGTLLGLSKEQLCWALGSAGTQSCGLWQFNADASMSKHLHAGRAASGGATAARLASHGFSGAREILEGERGFFRAMAPRGNPERVVEGLSSAFDSPRLLVVSLKPYPSCRHTHAVIDAVRALRERAGGRTPRGADVYTYQAAIDLCDRPSPSTPAEAKFSLQYCLAAAWEKGTPLLGDFDAESIGAETRRELAGRVSVVRAEDIQAGYPEQFGARVRMHFDDGTSDQETVKQPKGDPENPLSEVQIEEKFRAISGVDEPQAAAAIRWARSLSESDEVSPPVLTAGLPAGIP